MMEMSVPDFILAFKSAFTDKMDLEWGFLNGNCYWFAHILKSRFPGGNIYYDTIENHFLFKYNGKFYDIKGEHPDSASLINWMVFQNIEPTEASRIIRYCILKEPVS